MKSRGAGVAQRGFDYEIKKKGGRISSNYEKGGTLPKMPKVKNPMPPKKQAMMSKGGMARGR